MIAVVADDIIELLIEELSCCRVLVYLKRPVRELNLTIESHLISHAESGLRGTPRMETQMIQSVLAGCGKHLHPTTLICWRCTRQREDTTLQCTSKEGWLAVNEQAIALSLEATHAKGYSLLLFTIRHRKMIEVRRKLIPKFHVCYWNHVFAISNTGGDNLNSIKHESRAIGIYLNTYTTLIYVRINLHIANSWCQAKLHAPQNTIPHYLGIVGIRVSQIIDRDIVKFVVVNNESKCMLAFSKAIDTEYMGTYQALLHLTCILSVDKQTTTPHHSLKQ